MNKVKQNNIPFYAEEKVMSSIFRKIETDKTEII